MLVLTFLLNDRSDVIPTDNSFMHSEVTLPNTLTSSLISFAMAESKSRFATLSEEDLNLLLDDKDAKSTKRATKSALKVFHQYLKEKKADEPQTKDTLANLLKLFYAEARKADGTSYSKSTLNSLRFGLNRHFKATRGFDIINDSEFTDANKVFGAKCVDLKYPGTGARYVCKATDELTKNRREDDEGFDGGLMYEKPGSNCPVVSFELYLSHLNPLNEFLFQRPKRNVSTSEDVWYDNTVIGERTLGEKMKNISREAKLSKC
ncbi:hypothetical protein ACROYT_G010570 [Oculina patagonica]